jgi:hypothetical protein
MRQLMVVGLFALFTVACPADRVLAARVSPSVEQECGEAQSRCHAECAGRPDVGKCDLECFDLYDICINIEMEGEATLDVGGERAPVILHRLPGIRVQPDAAVEQ